jgi:hypothetical protein
VGRLEDIIDRNKHPGKHRKLRVPVGILLAAFVLLILVLMIFTDAAISPTDKPATAEPPAPSGEKRVDGVLLYRDKKKIAADAAAATPPTATAPTATPATGSAQPR